MDVDWLTFGTWVTGVGTIVVAAVAAFQDRIRSWISRPQLVVSMTVTPPDCHKVPFRYVSLTDGTEATCDCYSFRLRVENQGNQPAEQVEVFAAALWVRDAGGVFVPYNSWLPINLVWSHIAPGPVYFPRISPGLPKSCNLGYVFDPSHRKNISGEDNPALSVPYNKTLFSFNTPVKSNTLSHLIPPGTYRLTVTVGGANVGPVTKTLELSFTGEWFSEEARMLQREVSIRLVD